ncbi:MAG TPA: acetyl-CoA carboxylase biotin carboxyl carrier protein [Ohtaekwangia sp.]|nr:acetyl-CoA carboxylase biotin carboxyl carrier protein [Ohtaekwangia sp.]
MSKKTISKTPAKKAQKSSRPDPVNQPEMKTSEIRDLIDFISKTGLNEVDIETKELKLHVKREPDQKVFKSSMVSPATHAVVTHQPATPVSIPTPAVSQPKVEKLAESGTSSTTVDIKSPMIGTFYRSGTPDSPPFVSVGDKVTKGQTVCIIEAMKLFNEIESEVSGTIVKVAIENATPVEYDQVLFVVEPD